MLIHTSVSDDYRGQGIAEALIKLVVKQAIEENKKIIPLCLLLNVFDLNPEYQKIRK